MLAKDMIHVLPSDAAPHPCTDPERCDYLHTIDVSSVRAVFSSAALRSGDLRGGYTYGGIEHPYLTYVVGDDRVTVFFATRCLEPDRRFPLPDWDTVKAIHVEAREQ